MADPEGIVVRYRVDGHPEAHDLWWVPDEMLAAMRAGHFPPLPASVAMLADWGEVLLHVPTEAIRGRRSDVLAIIEKGWRTVAPRRQPVALADLPLQDSADFPEVPEDERANHFAVGGPLTPLTGVPDRPMGKTLAPQILGNLAYLWASIDLWQEAARAGIENPPAAGIHAPGGDQ